MSYNVVAGDTLSKIAAHFNVSLAALESANPQIKNPNLIYVGESINIPGSSDQFGSTPSSAPGSDLKRGQTGSAVKQLQSDLVKLGYMSQVDMNTGPGIFGPHTQAAVTAFQRAWGLPQTGYYGSMTRAALGKALAGQKPPSGSSGGGSTSAGGRYPVYCQEDPRWGSMKLIDGSYNIANAGCALTSTAMLLAGMGKTINGQAITPPVLDRYLQAHQNPADGSCIEWYTAAHAVGLNPHSVDGSTIDAMLRSGHPVIMNIHNGNHWVLVTGKDANGYICQDPAYGNIRHLSSSELSPWRGWAMY